NRRRRRAAAHPQQARGHPMLAKLVIKGTSSASRLWLARRMAQAIAAALPGRAIHMVADAAYAGKELTGLPAAITWTTRLRKDAALYDLPPARTGRRGRPCAKGDKLPPPARLAATTAFVPVTVTRYGTTATVHAAAVACLWYGVFGPRPVQVMLIRPGTQPRPSHRPPTWPPSSAGSSSPQDF